MFKNYENRLKYNTYRSCGDLFPYSTQIKRQSCHAK